MKWEHFTFEERKLIHFILYHKAKLNEIAEILGKDPTSVSKEIKRNRFISKDGIEKHKMCVKVLRYPYVCNACTLKYTTCPFAQFKYDAKKSQEKANHRLISTRIRLNIDKESFDKIDACIKEGVSQQRTRIFYCDSFKSSQKGNVENMNRQLRKYMKKGRSMDSFTQDDIKQINQIIINTKIASLGGFTPKEAFIKTFSKNILDHLFAY